MTAVVSQYTPTNSPLVSLVLALGGIFCKCIFASAKMCLFSPLVNNSISTRAAYYHHKDHMSTDTR